MSEDESAVPNGWVVATVSDFGEFINGFGFKKTDWSEEGIPIIRIQNLTDSTCPMNRTTKVVDAKYKVRKGDLLVSWSATLDAFVWDGPTAYVNQHIFKVVPSDGLDKQFVYFALREAILELARSAHLHGTAMKHVNRGPFLNYPVALPPLAVQHRIVDKIETLFAQLDKGEEALRAIQRQLQLYRQSVLKAAVTGELTRDWREANEDCVEPASGFLGRILNCRREKWSGRGKYKEPTVPGTISWNDLPTGWVWTSLDTLILEGPTNGVSPKPAKTDTGVPSFKLTATTSGQFVINETTVKFVGIDLEKDSKYWLKSGDVLVQRGNTIEYVGTAAIFPGPDNQYIYPDLMMRLRFVHPLVAKWVVVWMNFGYARKYLRSLATGTAGNMPKINGATLRSLPIPLPSMEEIECILWKLNETDAQIDPVSKFCGTELNRSRVLRQSVLKEAFAGRLVPQVPGYESANKLLDRIRAAGKASQIASGAKAQV